MPTNRPSHPEQFHGLMDGDHESVVRSGNVTNQEIKDIGRSLGEAKPSPMTTFEKSMNTPNPLDQARGAQRHK